MQCIQNIKPRYRTGANRFARVRISRILYRNPSPACREDGTWPRNEGRRAGKRASRSGKERNASDRGLPLSTPRTWINSARHRAPAARSVRGSPGRLHAGRPADRRTKHRGRKNSRCVPRDGLTPPGRSTQRLAAARRVPSFRR